MHIKTKHTLSSKRKVKSLTVLNEDTSILEDSLDESIRVTIDETSNTPDKAVIECDWIPCDFKSTMKDGLTKHIGDEHIPELKKKYLPPDVTSVSDQDGKKETGTHPKTEHSSETLMQEIV